MSEFEIEACAFKDIFELAAEAKDDGIRAKQRTGAQWFQYDDAGMICLWEPGNRSSTKRISHWWVHPDHRGEGIGAALFEHAIEVAKQSDAETLDIYAYDQDFIENHGFEHHPESSQAMNDAQYYRKETMTDKSETINCTGCEEEIHHPVDDHYFGDEPYCHQCVYAGLYGRGPLADYEYND